MTREDAIKVLIILKAAYPASYKGLSSNDANGVVGIWQSQFINTPYSVVLIAVQQLISTKQFPPSIYEVKQHIGSLYYQALQELPYKYGGLIMNNEENMAESKVKALKEIIEVSEPFIHNKAISLGELMKNYDGYLRESSEDIKQIGGN